MTKKRRWKTDPLTGLRYEEGSLLDFSAKTGRETQRSLEKAGKAIRKFLNGMEREKEEKPKEKGLFNRVVKEIEKFTPAREKLGHEYNYQLNLHGWLKRKFPSAVIERQKGASRPDIVIDDIAIETKGPTGRR